MDTQQEIPAVLERISNNKIIWTQVSIAKKIMYLKSAMDNLRKAADGWVQACAQAKGLANDLAGQEWLSGPCILMRQMRLLIQALQANGTPKPSKIYQKENQQYVAKVLPANTQETLAWRKFSAEIWIEEGKQASQGQFYRAVPKPSGLALVLGAGNVASIAPLDALHKLFTEGEVCIVKLNPVNAYLLNTFNKIFSQLIADDFLAFVTGDGQVGAELCQNSKVDSIHVTGSHITHDNIVKSVHNKRITSELGCVTPTIIIPENWSDKDFKFQAQQIISGVENNASFNCNAMKVLVTWKQWSQRKEFLQCIRTELKKCPPRKSYYPGAQERYQQFLQHYPQYEVLGEKYPECIPWTFIPNLTIDSDAYAFQTEAFCGLLMEVTLDADNVADFIKKSTDFCNNKLWGTLSCSIFIPPKTERAYKKEVQQMIGKLRYGAIGINCWAALSYVFCSTTWGAYPGHTLDNIQSGIGTVHNGFLFDFPEKSVIRAPFKIWPTPAWFYTNKNLVGIGKALLQHEYNPSPWNFMRLVYNSCRG